jgi:hypothetical protein
MAPTAPIPTEAELRWYSRPGPLTDLSAHAEHLRGLPEDLASLCGVVQGVLLHGHLGALYGLELAEERRHTELNLRSADQRLAVLLERDDAPLIEPRPPAQRQLGTCRDFTLLLCALLRWQGRAARARCGFGGYFVPGLYEDHWVCEIWDEDLERWRLVDAQIDEIQRRLFGPKDPLDVRRDEFIVGGEAWEGCRAGRFETSRFGLSSIHESGLWFVCGDFVRDVAALNKVELLPWDMWGVMLHPALRPEPIALGADEVVARLPAADLDELDRVALLASIHVDLPALRRAYRGPRWQVPAAHPALAGIST